MRTSRNVLLATTAFALAMTAQPALAQESDEGANRYSEIIVTARKKQESILKVPVVQNVITNESLENFQINNLEDITTKIPGLVTGNAVLAIGQQMSLRGVGSNSLDQGVDQSVSLNVDGLQLTHGLAFRAASFDLQQVEVLKGPQALYFGKNSTAGVISFRSADPGDEVEVKAKAGYEFESREKRAELVYSTPLSDTVGLRLAGLYTDSKGIFKNKATAAPGLGGADPRYTRFGGGESWLVRGTMLWEPTTDTTVRLKANLARDDNRAGGLNTLNYCPDGTNTIFPFSMYHPDEDCTYNKTTFAVDLDPAAFPGVRNGGTPFLKLDQDFGTLEIAHDISSELAFTSVTGYYRSRADTMINGTFAAYSAPLFYADNVFKRKEYTQELRLDSDFASPINFTVGAFYQDGKVSNDFILGGNGAFGAPPTLISGKSTIDIESVSAFGQLRWAASDQLEIAGGVRYTDEKRDLKVTDLVSLSAGVFTPTDPVLAPGSDKLSSKNWSPELTVTYTPTDDFTVFAALKQAYKSGSFAIVIPANPGDDKSFGDEKVRGGEVGIKSRLMDRALSLDIAGYYYRYYGLQTGVNEAANGSVPVLRTINAGKAEVYGVDFEAHYSPPSIDGLRLNLAVNWNKTEFLELSGVPCFPGQTIAQGCDTVPNPNTLDPATGDPLFTSQDLAGIPFVRAPEWMANFGFEYEMPVGDDMRVVLTNDNQFSSSYLTVLGDSSVRPDFKQPKALKVDLGLTLYGPEDRWSVSVFGKNITDKLRPGYCSVLDYDGAQGLRRPLTGGVATENFGEGESGCSFAQGRSIGVTLGIKY